MKLCFVKKYRFTAQTRQEMWPEGPIILIADVPFVIIIGEMPPIYAQHITHFELLFKNKLEMCLLILQIVISA